jgi:molybdopterin-guanine dinucleotide biosynthesis protein A
VADALAAQCAGVIVCGRAWSGLPSVADPAPGLGPMGGLAAALAHAAAQGHDELLVAPCDLLDLPRDSVERLRPAPAVAQGQWLVGLWPTALAGRLAALLEAEGAISARRWRDESGAVARPFPMLANINTPGDLPPGDA